MPVPRGLGDPSEAGFRCTAPTGRKPLVPWEAEMGLSSPTLETREQHQLRHCPARRRETLSSYRQLCFLYHTLHSQPVTSYESFAL